MQLPTENSVQLSADAATDAGSRILLPSFLSQGSIVLGSLSLSLSHTHTHTHPDHFATATHPSTENC